MHPRSPDRARAPRRPQPRPHGGPAALLAALVLGAAPAALAAEPGDPVVPGVGIGPLRLGMTEAEARAAVGDAELKAGWASHVRRLGPWEIELADGKVVRVSSTADRTRPLLKGVTALDLSALERAAEGIGGCGPVQQNRGASVIECDGVRLIKGYQAAEITVNVVPAGAPLPKGPLDVGGAIRATTVPGANHAASPTGRMDPRPLPVYRLIPGVSLGPITLGMSQAQVRALGPDQPVRPGYAENILNVGHFEVQFEHDQVVRVSVFPITFGTLIEYGEARRPLPRTGLTAAAEVVGGCGPVELLEGGTRVLCPLGVRLYEVRKNQLRFDVTSASAPGRALGATASAANTPADLALIGAPPQVVCTTYARPGEADFRFAVRPGQTVCVETRAVAQSTVAADIVGTLGFNTCDRVEAKGAEPATVTCAFDGVRFVFGGPNGTLSAVEGVPFRTQ